MALATKAIDRLKAAANLKATERKVTLSDGTEFSFWATPMTMAERERATKDAKTDDINSFALQLLVSKAQNENGTRMFTAGDVATLKHEVRDEDVQQLMLAVLQSPEESEELDLKST